MTTAAGVILGLLAYLLLCAALRAIFQSAHEVSAAAEDARLRERLAELARDAEVTPAGRTHYRIHVRARETTGEVTAEEQRLRNHAAEALHVGDDDAA